MRRGRYDVAPEAAPTRLADQPLIDVLLTGSVTATGGKVVSTCTLIRDGTRRIVIDPGMADSPESLLVALESVGVDRIEVTDVVLSHHHPDHTMHAGLFGRAAVHDYWAIYRGSSWEDSDAEGRQLSPAVHLIRVPGHTTEDIATVIETTRGAVVCAHLWFDENGPAEDPYAEDPRRLHESRVRVLKFAKLVVPGHGTAFVPSDDTPT